MSRAPATVADPSGPFGQPYSAGRAPQLSLPLWQRQACGNITKVIEPLLGGACPGWNRKR
jgi:hypothetical protein